MNESDEAVSRRATAWLEGAVVGLDLCPFAEPVLRRGRLHLVVSRARTPEDAVRAVLSEAVALIEALPDARSTTLIVLADGFSDFDDLLEVSELVEDALDTAEAGSLLQLATFHPDYRFADVPPDHLGNYTNRAPFPIVQLLRVDEVGEAIDGHPDPDGISDRNIARLEGLGLDAVTELWRAWDGSTREDG